MTKWRSTAPLGVARDDLAVARRARPARWSSAVSSRTSRIDRFDQGFAGFDHAAWQGVEVQRRPSRAPHHQHLAVADDGGADGEKRAVADRCGYRARCSPPHQPVDRGLRRASVPSASRLGVAVDHRAGARNQRLEPAAALSARCGAVSGRHVRSASRCASPRARRSWCRPACRGCRARSDRRPRRRRSPCRGP